MDIGCSLGYGIAQVFGSKATGLGLSPPSLHGFLNSIHISSCGECGACKDIGIVRSHPDAVPIDAYCIDAAPRNMKVMSKVSQHFLRRQNAGSLTVRNAYVTAVNATASVEFPALCLGEMCSMYAFTPGLKALVPTARVDQLAEEYKLPYIDILRVSVGGDEPAVLHSARELLEERRIGAIVFQYSQAGLWTRDYTLKGVLNALDYFGYSSCVLAGKTAYLPLTACFVETFNELPSATIVCSVHPIHVEV